MPETAIRLTTQQLPATPVQAASAGANIGEAAAQIDPQQPQETPADQTPTDVSAEQDLATTTGGAAPSPDKAQLIEVNFAADSYRPTASMASNARRALEVRAAKPPSQRGMTAVGIARARDIQNRKELSPDTVRRMKAYFDRHEVDKQGSTWKEQGKGWQAWNGWGGDAGQTWANAIVERLNKERQQNSAAIPAQVNLEASRTSVTTRKTSAEEWIDAIIDYRRQFHDKASAAVQPIIEGKTLVELSQPVATPTEFVMPTPEKGEKGDDFLSRCMANPTMNKDYPDNAQRYAVCQAQLKDRK